MIAFIAAATLAATAPPIVPAHALPACVVANARTIGELDGMLSDKAVQAIRLASAAPSAQASQMLTELVAPEATSWLGAGDVGLPLGTGTAGLRAMALRMRARSYRYLGWDYIPTPITDPCGEREVSVEFTDPLTSHVYPVTFAFRAGRIVSVRGWTRSYVSGTLTPSREN